MTARVDAHEPATDARLPARFNSELFDARCAALWPDAMTDAAKAERAGIDPGTLSRFRNDRFRPRLDVALHVAGVLEVSVEQLWVRP